MTPGARVAAAIEVLDAIAAGAPAEKALTSWARGSRYAGSKDRAAVRDHVYDVLRRRRSAAWIGRGHNGRALMIGALALSGADLDSLFSGTGHSPAALGEDEQPRPDIDLPLPEARDMPDWVARQMINDLGDGAADTTMEALRERAPIFLRVNTARVDRNAACTALAADDVNTEPHPSVQTALIVTEGARRIRQSACYLDGRVELQDAHSQAAVLSLPLNDGDRVLDFCAGGGGKSLAIAARADVSVTAHDIALRRMQDIGPRAARAKALIGIVEELDALPRQGFDLVVVDAPCSGSGSWRRDPEGKWSLTQERLEQLNRQQDAILAEASNFVASSGTLAYMTCSVLACENKAIVDRFLSNAPGSEIVAHQTWLPSESGDGFHLSTIRINGLSR